MLKTHADPDLWGHVRFGLDVARDRALARRTGRTVIILHRHPLRTSDRKARLYSWGEMSLFAFKTVVGAGRTLRNADQCFAWYDGRR